MLQICFSMLDSKTSKVKCACYLRFDKNGKSLRINRSVNRFRHTRYDTSFKPLIISSDFQLVDTNIVPWMGGIRNKVPPRPQNNAQDCYDKYTSKQKKNWENVNDLHPTPEISGLEKTLVRITNCSCLREMASCLSFDLRSSSQATAKLSKLQ